jgi:Aminoglycoside-2''-adenylyltransferase
VDSTEFFRWYGPWIQSLPSEVAQIMAGMAAPWWIVGGWAIEVFTGRSREHEDIDVAIFRGDLPILLDHLLPNYCVWSNLSGTLRPLRTPNELLEGCRQLWVRRDATSPWLFDLLLTPHEADTWISVRDDRIRRTFAETVFTHDDIHYLRPEIVLHLKAKLNRAKDDSDFSAALSLLESDACAWLRSALEIANPDHPWLERL